MKKKPIAVLLVIMLLAALVSGCADDTNLPDDVTDAVDIPSDDNKDEDISEDKIEHDSIFTLQYDSEMEFNPFRGTNIKNMAVSGLVYEGLFAVNGSFEAEPVLCESYETQNGKDFVITLKPGLTFHNGENVTAQDVVYSITRAKNSAKYASRLSTLTGISARDSLTVEIAISRENYSFPLLLDIPIVAYNTGGDTVPPGTGPYELIMADTPYLKVFKNYRDYEKLSLSSIYLSEIDEDDVAQKFSDQSIDMVYADSSLYNIHANCETRTYDTTRLMYVGFNTEDAVMGDQDVRRALSYIIDREVVCAEFREGTVKAAPVIFNKAASFYDVKWEDDTEYSIVKFSEIFDGIGMTDDSGDGYLDYPSEYGYLPINIDFIVNEENSERVKAAERIASAMYDIGVRAKVRALPWEEYTEALENGDFDMYLAEVQLQSDFDLTELLTENGSLNYGKTIDANYPMLINNFLSSQDDARISAARTLCDYIRMDAVIIPILYRVSAVTTHRSAISGASPTQANVFHDVTNWTITP